ncbi:DUF2612 domain-containing protein [Rhizobium sp. F40D2]|uniref:DUF2612 domain-containing protein n=1 Tax=Rhizobium sp. F40D2 TaxID=3453141 RepID=UPI003F1F3BFF
MTCFDESTFIEGGIDRVLTRYRESPKLLHVIRTFLRKIWEAQESICDLPSYFDLDTAVGDQLTILGKWMGFPRCHCVCDVQPVFGFQCTTSSAGSQPIVGFCNSGTWDGCGDNGISDICIDDDDLYRSLLISRSYQMQSRYSWADLTTSIQVIFGSQAKILDAGHSRVVIAPFRALTELETAILQIIPRVLPVAPGISTRWHFGTFEVFGFGAGWGGFCEEWLPEGARIATSDGDELTTDTGDHIITGPLTRGADWMCEIDLKPYSC